MEILASKYFYCYILIATIAYPLLQSFESKLQFYKKWKSLLPAILLCVIVHGSIDILFTNLGVWSFNPNYILGIKILYLPIEEWLWFIVTPYACVFIYEVLYYFFEDIKPSKIIFKLSLFFGIVLILIATIYHNNLYTCFYFSLAALICFIAFYFKPIWWGNFLRTYLVSLLPFLVMNGLLTGSFTENPVVLYNTDHIIGYRLLNIPVEDTVFSFVILAGVIASYEFLRKLFKKLSVKNN
jgi:lycopene cyclase domain-containing protein|tara:strand:- start:32853 stop:33572 length:720 start_codon:yes stop_codon:yes gene_type:complete